MYTVIRKYYVIPGRGDELMRRVQEDIVPILNQVPGFQAYYALQAGRDKVITMSLFDTCADAREAGRQTAAWIAEHAAWFFHGLPEVMAGEVQVHSELIHALPLQEEPLQGVF